MSLEFGKIDSDWDFGGETREAQIDEISFQIEERIESGLTFGATIGYVDLRVVAPRNSTAETRKFDGQFFGIYIRQPFRISDHVSWYGLFSLRYTSGDESGGDDEDDGDDEIDWTQTAFEFGLGLRFSKLRVTPYIAHQDVDGDISGDDGTDTFEPDEDTVQGLRFDYYIEETAFIRFEFVTGGREGGYLSFVRRY